MSDPSAPPITDVTGGVAGLAAAYDAVRRIADRYDELADRLRGAAATGGRAVLDPAVLESAVLSPGTFAAAEVALTRAVGGLGGCLPASVLCTADAAATRAAVVALEECDRVVAASMSSLDGATGRLVGEAAPLLAPVLAPVALGVALTDPGVAVGDVETAVRDHPGLTQQAVAGSGGLLDGLLADLPPASLPCSD